ncbi:MULTISPECIES: threonine--tRNA ligase [Sphingobacterium]|uniref:Threonine--tRNA ligase n=1 Tax=Sphingobacterium kitahiroshimense TaxID=470446 RepID=A0ABV0BPC9_9SPHI|nr:MULTISPECIES: threonine--tRNA ligase [Sphingobacterium]MBB2952078.1 threonyl-tRNA synthetase [Sphingobacterium sp. JUb56]MCS3553915.1 threonyl-tRNA synthetase [Sphingobacterium sp. JUb21]MCW2260532.1 threonyl-tRNA synthetase [Sphingobacterium kitahiroshimense]NJI71591.1 threonine--tRNA ligase [Sphingobacterium sp. B16(2022)]TCR00981.1 threonyl-tRNA synthetase [Sphingobacterium sp. JUb78]
MIKITLPDGSVREYEKGTSAAQVALSISEGLARNVLAAEVNGEIWDSSRPIEEDSAVKLLTWNDTNGKSTFWHSSAHLLAEALEDLYPGIKFGIGPAIETGFYYDVDFGDREFSSDDFKQIEDKMLELAKRKEIFERKAVSKADAIAYFTEKGDEYKLDLIKDLEDGKITFYTQGEFTDLCRGPHIPNTGFIKAIKLTNVAGAYWRGDESRKQLTRIYGVTFPKASELTEYLKFIEEAKKRDHRKLGKELELFAFSEKVGAGLPLWLPKGAALRQKLQDFLQRAQLKSGYEPVMTPHIGNKQLYVTSGHYDKYGEDSFQPIRTPVEDEEFFLKPMNCPHHCEIYKTKPRSYKDLPVRFAEFGTVYRYEQSGELHGLTRVRGFTQDDAHLFCRPDQVKEEFKKVIDLVLYVFKALGFEEYTAQISLRDPENRTKYIGTDENWALAESAIIEAAAEKELSTVVEYGEAAFYGPKLDFMVKDALGRRWQLGTIQVDYNLPERFELEYTGSDNAKHRPVMIHRAPFGSMERFIAVLIEHCAGEFPLWLAPEQFIVLPVSEKYEEYAKNLLESLNNSDIRGLIDLRDEKVGRKIRDAEVKKLPYMLIVGEKEAESGTISVRKHGSVDMGSMTADEFREVLIKEITV